MTWQDWFTEDSRVTSLASVLVLQQRDLEEGKGGGRREGEEEGRKQEEEEGRGRGTHDCLPTTGIGITKELKELHSGIRYTLIPKCFTEEKGKRRSKLEEGGEKIKGRRKQEEEEEESHN
jgi:hypothetical protein